MTSRRWVRSAMLLVTEPPFVPRVLWPSTAMHAVVDRVPAVLDTVLDRIDITQVIIDHISVPRIVDSIDVEAVLAKVNLSGIAAKVVDDIDLPDIIRDSTGALASESVVGVRLQSASADDLVDRVVGRLIPGRRRAQLEDKAQLNDQDQLDGRAHLEIKSISDGSG
jgi:hypothetical protein